MSASERLKAASGDCAGLQANRPRRSRFQPFRPLFRHRNQVGNRLAEKRKTDSRKSRWKLAVGVNWYVTLCRLWRHNKSALSFDAEKEGAGCGAPVTGWRIGLILRAPCSAAARALPQRTTCGGFWYFWPQKYKKKKVCENCNLPETSRSFCVKFRKTFFLCFSVSKSSKSHPTDSDVGVRTSESGVGRLRGFASKPSPPLSLSALRPLFRHRSQVGEGWHIKKSKKISTLYCIILKCVLYLHRESSRTHKILTRKIPLQP